VERRKERLAGSTTSCDFQHLAVEQHYNNYVFTNLAVVVEDPPRVDVSGNSHTGGQLGCDGSLLIDVDGSKVSHGYPHRKTGRRENC
jgi:hypothetical protein